MTGDNEWLKQGKKTRVLDLDALMRSGGDTTYAQIVNRPPKVVLEVKMHTDKEYDEWLKHKGEVDPEDQRYTWPGSKSPLPVLYRVLIALMLLAIVAAVAIGRWGR